MADDPTVLDAVDVIRRVILRDHRGVRVGKVVKYDATRRTADVQPFRKRRSKGADLVFEEGPIMDAPVGTWRLGGMVMAGELEKGDEVLIVTCEREIRPWWLLGKVHDPQSRRMHAAEDSVILPWISNLKRVITAQAAGTLYLGREDGSAGLTITRGPAPGMTTLEGTGPGSIKLGSTATIPVALATPTEALFDQLYGAIAGAAVVAADGGAAFKANLLAALASWVPGVDVAATKTVAE